MEDAVNSPLTKRQGVLHWCHMKSFIKKYWIQTLIPIICIAVAILFAGGCTQNARTKAFGGSMTVELPKGTKLVNATWKESQMWYLTRPMHDGETAETFTFKEKSSFGMMEGTVTFKETK